MLSNSLSKLFYYKPKVEATFTIEKKYPSAHKHIWSWRGADDAKAYRVVAVTILLWLASFYSYFLLPKWLFVLFRACVLVRSFVVFHDCCHGSLFSTSELNNYYGYVLGLLSYTPFRGWQGNHLYHHSIYGDADKFDPASTILFTRKAWDNYPWWKKAIFRVLRDPFVFFSLVPTFLWIFRYRMFYKASGFANIVLFTKLAFIVHFFGWDFLYYEFLYVTLVSGHIGFALFHWQHYVNQGYSVPHHHHNRDDAALVGSTYLLVPWWFKWVTVGIEYHHIHHYSTKIPCYNLQACHESAPAGTWDMVTVVGPLKAFKSWFHVMWNSDTQRFECFDIWEWLFEKYLPGL